MPQFGKGNQYRFGAPGGNNNRQGADISVESQDFVNFLGATSKMPSKMRTSLRKKVRIAGEQAATAVREEVQKEPISRSGRTFTGLPKSRGLRAGIARGVSSSLSAKDPAKAGVTIRASGKALPPEQKKLVKRYNRVRGWRHPDPNSARNINIATGGAKTLKAMGSPGAARAMRDGTRNAAVWHHQTGRPYFGKVLSARAPQLRSAALDAIEEARKQAGLP